MRGRTVLRQRDPVTRLFNRQHFMTEVEAAVAAAADGKGTQSLLLIEKRLFRWRWQVTL